MKDDANISRHRLQIERIDAQPKKGNITADGKDLVKLSRAGGPDAVKGRTGDQLVPSGANELTRLGAHEDVDGSNVGQRVEELLDEHLPDEARSAGYEDRSTTVEVLHPRILVGLID